MFGDEHLSVFRRTSDDENLNSFLQELQQQKLVFFKERIKRRAVELPSDEIGRYLIYLRESNLVDETGYTLLRAYLDHLYSNQTPLASGEEN
jgi:hypothetical protein